MNNNSKNTLTLENWKYPFSCAQLDQLYWSFCGFLNAKGGQVLIKDVTLDAYQRDEFHRELGYCLGGLVPSLGEAEAKNAVSAPDFQSLGNDRYNIVINVKGGDPKKFYTRLTQPYTKILVQSRSGAQVIGSCYGLERLERKENCEVFVKRNEEKKSVDLNGEKFSKSNRQQHVKEVGDLAKDVREKNEKLKKLIGMVGDQSGDKVGELTEIVHMLHRMQELSLDLNHHYQSRSFNTCYKGLDDLA